MKVRKVISSFLVLVCLFITFSFGYDIATASAGNRTVYATTSASVKQGSYGYLYVYLDDLTDLSALNVSVYYDTEKITVIDVYNSASCVVNDIATSSGCVNASYIFDGNGSAVKTNLFYVYYRVNSSATIGSTYFDIVVNEAYSSSLADMDFSGSRCSLNITEQAVSKSCSISTVSSVSTAVGEELELSYRLSTYQIVSGLMSVKYDPELFEVISVTNGGFLTDKIVDVNVALDGALSLSFVGTNYRSQYDVFKVRLKTLKNVSEKSEIKLVVSELYDKELNQYSCKGCTTNVNISFDETYTEDSPGMIVSASYSAETEKVTATIKLEKDSKLGAGDFVLNFDTTALVYSSLQKGFSPSFFNVNDKNVENGVLKFSIISLADIVDAQTVLTVVFDTKRHCQDKTANLEISGSGLTDSLVNPILLNFVDAGVVIPKDLTEIPAKGHAYGEWYVTVEPTKDKQGEKRRECNDCEKYETCEIKALGYAEDFIAAVESLSENVTTEEQYAKIYSALQIYAKLTAEEKEEAADAVKLLQSAIRAYNSKAEIINSEHSKATELAFIPLSATFTFLAALWYLLKKKFWVK